MCKKVGFPAARKLSILKNINANKHYCEPCEETGLVWRIERAKNGNIAFMLNFIYHIFVPLLMFDFENGRRNDNVL